MLRLRSQLPQSSGVLSSSLANYSPDPMTDRTTIPREKFLSCTRKLISIGRARSCFLIVLQVMAALTVPVLLGFGSKNRFHVLDAIWGQNGLTPKCNPKLPRSPLGEAIVPIT